MITSGEKELSMESCQPFQVPSLFSHDSQSDVVGCRRLRSEQTGDPVMTDRELPSQAGSIDRNIADL